MKKIIILFLLISTFGYTQNTIQNDLKGLWRTNGIIGLHPSDEYNLSQPTKDEISREWLHGNSISFTSNSTFNSNYSAPCGNDCFPSSKGTFEMIDSTHIRLKLELIEVRGFCQNSTDSTHRDLGVFLIKNQENGYKLIRCSEKESDTQCEKYSEIANNLPQININDSSYKKVRLTPETREKKDVEILKTGLKDIPGFEPEKAKLLYTKYQYDQKRFVFEYKNRILLATYDSGSSQFILYDI